MGSDDAAADQLDIGEKALIAAKDAPVVQFRQVQRGDSGVVSESRTR
jgi:hypothetical protein